MHTGTSCYIFVADEEFGHAGLKGEINAENYDLEGSDSCSSHMSNLEDGLLEFLTMDYAVILGLGQLDMDGLRLLHDFDDGDDPMDGLGHDGGTVGLGVGMGGVGDGNGVGGAGEGDLEVVAGGVGGGGGAVEDGVDGACGGSDNGVGDTDGAVGAGGEGVRDNVGGASGVDGGGGVGGYGDGGGKL